MRQHLSPILVASLLACMALSSLTVFGFWKIGELNAPTTFGLR
ncbi:MAG TPA: hypothetical protein VFW47_12535 [Phenylobacterium sp.]|nr:hypothetical protein [Phenylobacterium sp.]